MEDKQYQKAFNQGYVLAEHAPTIMEVLNESVEQPNAYLQAMLSGGKQFSYDKAYELDKQKQNEKDKGKNDLDKNREHN